MFTSLAVLLSVMVGTVAADTPDEVGIQHEQKVKKVGTTHLAGRQAAAASSTDLADGEERPDPESAGGEGTVHGGPGPAPVAPDKAPKPANQNVVDATGTTHFGGLNHFDQRFADFGTTPNTQFSLEPPDQGLCVGNGFVVETVNTVIRVRNALDGELVTDAMPLNEFFGLDPEFIRPDGPFGDFTSDPKCYFDAANGGHWFVSLLELDIDSASNDFTGGSHSLLAVSTGSDPTGTFNLFSIDTTNDGSNGTPRHTNCPCYGDQPLIGADANGFYITTNEFPLFVAGFNGAMVYAMSKSALTSGSEPTVVSIFQPNLAEGQAYSIQPATTPLGAAFATEKGGSEYFLSALEFTGGLDNRIALWALTNTSSLSAAHPKVKMAVKVLDSEVYGLPPVMKQRDGQTPLRDFLKSLGAKEKLPLINSNDDRMNQAVYVNGQVWGALNTAIGSGKGARVGIAWFAVTPSTGKKLDGSVTGQGYVAVDKNHVVFPAIGANASGNVLVAFSLLGPSYFPSAAYAWLDASTGTGDVQVVSWGVGPADGFTGYPSQDPGDNGVERWGDYSAAVADSAGNLWFATETINQSCTLSEFQSSGFTCGGTRSQLANWGSTIAKVVP